MNTLVEKRVTSLIEFLKKVFVTIGYIAQLYAHIFNKLSAKGKAIQLTGVFSFVAIVILSQVASTLGIYTFIVGGLLATVILFVILAIKNM